MHTQPNQPPHTKPATPLVLPEAKRFQVVLADPPWDIQQKGKKSRGAQRHYDLMTLDRIKGMGEAVQALSTENAHLYLWVTNASLRDGYDVMEAWGYTPRSLMTWCKPRFTLGQYFRNATEHFIFGTRGKAPVQFRSQPSWGFWALGQHSVKPDEQYAVIDRISGPETRKLELFARRQPPGHSWKVWGNEIDSDVSLAPWGYCVPSNLDKQEPTGSVPALPEQGRA